MLSHLSMAAGGTEPDIPGASDSRTLHAAFGHYQDLHIPNTAKPQNMNLTAFQCPKARETAATPYAIT